MERVLELNSQKPELKPELEIGFFIMALDLAYREVFSAAIIFNIYHNLWVIPPHMAQTIIWALHNYS